MNTSMSFSFVNLVKKRINREEKSDYYVGKDFNSIHLEGVFIVPMILIIMGGSLSFLSFDLNVVFKG